MGQIIGNQVFFHELYYTLARVCMLHITIEDSQQQHQQQERQCLRLGGVCTCILFAFQSHLSLNVSFSIACEHRLRLHFSLAEWSYFFSYSSSSSTSAVSPSLVVFSRCFCNVCRLSLCKRFPNCVHAHSTANSVMATHNCTGKNIDSNRQ